LGGLFMYCREIWVNSRLLGTGQMQRVFTEDPNKNLIVGEEGHERFVSEASLHALRTELKLVKLEFDRAKKELDLATGAINEVLS